jgi:hypothetical protein
MPLYNAAPFPRIIGFQGVNMAIGVGTQVLTVPAAATHIMLGAGTLTGISMRLRFVIGGFAPQDVMATPAANANVPCPWVPIPFGFTSVSMIRSATAAADDYVAFFLG